MKLLYVANQRQAAEQAGLALRSVAPDVAVSWAASLGQARRWIDENRNVTALIIEVESDSRSFEALVTHARGIGVKVPVIGIPLMDTSDVLMSVRAVADEVVPRDAAFLKELPQAVSRTLFPRDAQVQQISVPPYDQQFQQQLRDAETAAARADERARDALSQLRAREESLQAVIEQEREVRVDLERRLTAAAGDLGRRDKELADATTVRQALEEKLTNALAELEQVRERESALTENLSDETRSLTQELAEAKRILRLADQLHATTKAGAAERIKEIQDQADARLAEATSITNALQRELAGTVAKHAESDLAHRKAIQALEATRHDLGARLMAAHDAQRQLEEQHASAMAATRAALLTAEQRANKQQTDAAAAAQSLGTKLAESVANAERLRAQLSEAQLAATSAARQATADRQAAAEQIARQRATFDSALADEVTRREALASDLAARDVAHRNAIQALEAARQDLEARLTAADDTRRQLEEQHASASAAARLALESAEQRATKQQTDAAAAAHAFDARLAESVANADRLRAQLSEAQLALTNAEQQATANRQAAAEQLAKQQATFDAALAEEVTRRRTWTSELAGRELAHQKALKELEATRQDLEARLAAGDEARRQLEEQHATSIAVVRGALEAVERRANKQQAEAAAALAHAQQQAASDRHGAAEETKRRQAEFETLLAKEVADRRALELRLAEHQQQAEAIATQAASALAALQGKLIEQAAALLEAERQASSDRHDAAEQAARRQAAFDTELAGEVAQRQNVEARLGDANASLETLQAKLADTTAALQSAETQAANDRHAAAQEAAARQAEFEASLARETANTQAVVKQLADEESARQLAQHQYQSEIESWQRRLAEARQQAEVQSKEAAAKAAQRQAGFDQQLAQEVAQRQNLAAKLTEAEAALQKAASDHAAAMTAAETLEIKLADTAEALQSAVTRAADERRTAAETAATQQAEFEASLARETANTQAVVKQLADYRRNAEAELADQRQHAERQIAQLQQQADARLAEAMANAATTLEASLQQAAAQRQAAADRFAGQQAALEAALAHEVARREAADTALAALQTASVEAERRFVDGVAAMRQQAAEHDTRLRERAAKDKATAQQSLEALSRDHASERTRLQAIVAERDRKLAEQATHHQVANEAAAKAKADLEHRLRTALEAGQRDGQTIKRVEQQVAELSKDLDALNRQREVLKSEAERVPVLQKLIDDTQAEYRLRFDHTPIGMWRSRRDGAIVQANQALVGLLRYKTLDDLLKVNFSTAVFESADELQWLVDRCLASRTTETVETTWRRKDGVGIVVRLMAIATSSEGVDFVAMDITNLRALEEKLRNSQRMESVARYASEVAVTCNKLLGQVNQQGQQWLTRIESDSARHQGALLLDDVTRAAGLLGQLTVYGTEQKNAPELVEVKQVLQDLEPILTRVAGSRVDIVVPKSSSPYHLDVDIERVERILVNVAAYGRERMPFGGRLMIDVSPVVVDRTFVEKYPNVRPGAHVLLTVTEKKGAPGPDLSMTVRDQASGGNGSAPSPHKPGVDLGALQALVNECGGHLWILAEPGGNMELRIHLPRRVLDDRAPAKKPGRGGWMSKLASGRNRETV